MIHFNNDSCLSQSQESKCMWKQSKRWLYIHTYVSWIQAGFNFFQGRGFDSTYILKEHISLRLLNLQLLFFS